MALNIRAKTRSVFFSMFKSNFGFNDKMKMLIAGKTQVDKKTTKSMYFLTFQGKIEK
jgi:hypothetical protein